MRAAGGLSAALERPLDAVVPGSRAEVVVLSLAGAAWLAFGLHELTGGGVSYGEEVPLLHSAAHWALMVGAMMGPGVLPAVRHVTNTSLQWRSSRAVTEFVAAYAILWGVVGVFAIAAASAVPASAKLAPLALGGAAVWELTPLKRRFLRNCHRAVPLPATGWRATAGCLRFGVVHGTACIGSCWCLMAFMALASPRPHVGWAALLTALALVERSAERPRRATRQAAAVLIALAVVSGFSLAR
jgi:predicted metal-binding membrane protein